jgi:hypothetical protein
MQSLISRSYALEKETCENTHRYGGKIKGLELRRRFDGAGACGPT